MSEQTVLPNDTHMRNTVDKGLQQDQEGADPALWRDLNLMRHLDSNSLGVHLRASPSPSPQKPPHPHLDSMEILFPSWGTRPFAQSSLQLTSGWPS